MPYRSLNPDLIVKTTARLSARMEARFGDRGLTLVAKELTKFAQEEVGLAKRIAQPRFLVRSLVYLFIASGIAVIAYIAWTVKIDIQASPSLDMFEGVEAFINLLILLSAGIWFLLNLEARMKRHDVLVRINQLRSIAHVIDMHQLSKDPMSDLHAGAKSESAPESDLHGYDLVRYLDYCADLLALTGKLASVYLEYIEDPVVIASVNDFESLTGELSRKIWQKVTVLELQGGFQAQTETVQEQNRDGSSAQTASESGDLPEFLK
ncbi:MAG: hypothetical protein NXH72_08305 [Hyphomonadaceae bacterium]|nr:hypothetical protein [Hyphomonadaceae bacterium]